MPLIEYNRGKIESYMLAVQHIFNPPSTPSLSAPGNVGVDEPLDVGYTDPPTISEPETGRTWLRLFPDGMLITI